jgi:transcriptional regulator with XRE-family HTH domain
VTVEFLPGFAADRWRAVEPRSSFHDERWLIAMHSRLPGEVYTVLDEARGLGFIGVLVSDPDGYEAYNPDAILWRDPSVFELTDPVVRAAALPSSRPPVLPAFALVAPGYDGNPAGRGAEDRVALAACLAEVRDWCADGGLAGLHVLFTASAAVETAVASLGGLSYPITGRWTLPVRWQDWSGYLAGLSSKRAREIGREYRVATESLQLAEINPFDYADDLIEGRCALLRRYGQDADMVAERQRLALLGEQFGDRLTAFGGLREGRLVAGSLCLWHGRTLQVMYSALTEDGRKHRFAHFASVYYAVIARVNASSCDEIDYGISHSAGKQARGCQLERLSGHVLPVSSADLPALRTATELLRTHAEYPVETDSFSAAAEEPMTVPSEDSDQAGYRRRAATLLRSTANDLKRDEASAANDLGLSEQDYQRQLSGEADPDWTLISRAAQRWPLNERDLLPLHDDVPDGLRIHRLADSLASERVLQRGGADYYSYRDTAMSRVSTFRPEHIRMLRVVADDDPHNPGVQWNDGHLLYQFTYFVGPVNYYHSWQGVSHCVPMDTGDSVWGVPFAPHSFTSRDAGQDAYILALTYGGDLLGDSQRELAVLGPDTAARLALPADSPGGPDAEAVTLRSLLQGRLLSIAEAATRTGIDASRIDQFCTGDSQPTWQEREALADGLGVSVRDLLPRRTAVSNGVTVRHRSEARQWCLPDADAPAYRLRRLADDPIHPDTGSFEITVLATDNSDPELLRSHQHSYLYVLGGTDVRLRWEHAGKQHDELVQEGDSAYAVPGAGFGLSTSGAPATVLLLRIGGAVTTDVRYALGDFTERQLNRYLAEDRRWYRKEGRSAHEVEERGTS